jgi:hypothetical protein
MHSALKTLVVSVGFMIDAYDLFVIGIVLVMIGTVHPEAKTETAGTPNRKRLALPSIFSLGKSRRNFFVLISPKLPYASCHSKFKK